MSGRRSVPLVEACLLLLSCPDVTLDRKASDELSFISAIKDGEDLYRK